jgi:hypothetical protein
MSLYFNIYRNRSARIVLRRLENAEQAQEMLIVSRYLQVKVILPRKVMCLLINVMNIRTYM